MFVILEPYSQGETSTPIPDFASDADAVNNGFKATTTHLGQTFTNVFETNPTNVEVNGKYLKLTLDSYFDDIYKFLKNFHFFYEEQAENGKIIRGDVAASLSQSTKLATSNSTGLVKTSGAAEPLEAKDQFEFEIVKILIKDEEPDKIFYFYTSNRTLTIKDSNGLVAGANVVVDNFLDQTYTDHNEYYDTAAADATQTPFSLGNGITTGEDANGDKFFYVEKDPNGGRLTQNSTISNASFDSQTYTTTDEFGLTLEIPNDTTAVLDNKIKNPTLHAEIIPSIGGQGYIAIKMSKTNGNSFLNMVGVTKDENDTINNSDSVRTIRHGSTNGDSDGATHPVTGDLSVTSVNAFNNTALDFNFKGNGTQEISSIVTGDELKVEVDEYEDNVILMRLNRFPRHGITYSIGYSHQLNLASGFFDQYNHGVLAQNAISVTNQLKEVTATVGKLKVYYPPNVPQSFNDASNDVSSDYTAYYYVDITFTREGEEGNVDITAKYNNDYEYQYESGHNIHHGLIIDSGAADGNINEDITRTRIGNINSATGDFTPVDLRSNSNQTGNVLRIEVPIAVTGASASNRYPYELGNNPGLTKYNLADSNNTPSIHLIDREELDEDDNSYPDPQYYYINVMDSQGNVVSPIGSIQADGSMQPENLIKDDNFGIDSNQNSPGVASIEYKVRWDSNGNQGQGEWVKELVLTHHQDLQGAGVATSLALIEDDDPVWTLSTPALASGDSASVLTVSINDSANTLLTSEVAAGNITLAYTKPTDDAQNILTNWLGFEIEEYNGDDAKTVTLPTGEDSNPALPSFSSLSLGDITDDTGSFSVPLTWAEIVDDDGISYEVGVSTDGGSSYTVLPDSGITVPSTSNTGATISGLSYGQAYTFRVRASTYEFGPYSSSVSLSAQVGPAGQLSNFSLTNDVGPEVVASWDKPANVTQFKIEYSDDIGVNWTPTEGLGTAAGFVETTDGGSTTVSYTFSSLNGNTNYTIRASYSTSSTAPYTYGDTVDDDLLTYPPKVEGLASATITTSGFTLSWTHITNVGNGDFSSYYVEQSDDNGANWTDITPDDGLDENTNSLDVSELDDATQYLFRVKAENSSGAGNWSDNLTVETLESAPVVSINTQVSTPTNDTTPSFTLTSDKAGTIAITSSHNPAISLSSTTVNSGNTTFTFDTLAQGTYNVSVQVTNSDGEVSNTATLDAFEIDTTAPQFTSGEVPNAGTSLTINFGENLGLGNGGSIEGFTINLTGQGDSSFTSVAFDQNDSKKIIFSGVTIYDATSTTAVSVTYVQPTTQANRLRDGAGNLLAGFTSGSGSITNNSSATYTPDDTTSPSFGAFSYSVPAGDADFWDADVAKLSLDPGQSVTVTLSVDITDDTSAPADITATIADALWTASNPDGNTFKWNRTFTNSETGNNGTTTTISGTTVTAEDEAENSTTSGSTGNITVDKYVYEDPQGKTSFDIELLSGTDAKPGNVKFVLEYQLNGTLTVRRDIGLAFQFGKDNSFATGIKTLTFYESVSEGTNAAATISNSGWVNNKYEIQAYSTNLGDATDSYNNNNGIGLGEKYVRTNISYTNANNGTDTIHHTYVSDGVSQGSHGSLVRADKPWYCVLDVSGNDNSYWEQTYQGEITYIKANHFTLEKHSNHVKENPRTFDVIKGYYDSTGNEIGIKFKLPQYRFVPDISYNREIIDPNFQNFGDEDWGEYDNSLTIGNVNTTNWMYRDDIRRKIGILEPEIKGYYIKGKEKNSENDYDIILQPNKFGTWKDEDSNGNLTEASSNNTLYGKTVDISRDGKIAIVGAPNESWTDGSDSGTGVVRVYEVSSNGSLTQKGPNIKLASTIRFGEQVVINGDGSRIAISDPGDYDANTPARRGFIYIYEYGGAEWTSMINDQTVTYGVSLQELDSNYSSHSGDGDGFGLSMVMSEDGNNILIGAPYGLSRKGYIGMIKYTEPTTVLAGVFPGEGEFVSVQGLADWSILGVIDGQNEATTNPSYDGDKFGFSVDMVKFQPEYIAVGAPGDKSVSVFRGDKYQHVFTANDNLYDDIAQNVSEHTDTTYNGVTTTTGTDQYGSGLTLNITVNGGVVSNVVVNSVGSGYEQYDDIYVAADAIGGAASGNQFRITVPEANIYQYKRRCSPNGIESGGDKTIGRTDSGDKDVGYSIKIENNYITGDGTSSGDVTSVDFGYAIGYTRDENGTHTIVVGAPEENYRISATGDEKGRIRIFVWDEDYSNSVYQWTSDKDKGGYGDNESPYRDFNKGSSIAIERNAKFFMVQRYGHGNSNQNGRANIFYKAPRWIDTPTTGLWTDGNVGNYGRWSTNGGRELGHIRDGTSSGDDFGASIAISEGGEKIIIGAPYSTSSNEKGYVTIHLPNSKYTNTTLSATESNYTFTEQEKALFPVQQDNAPRGYLYGDSVGPTNSSKFGNLRKYEFIYMFNEWEIKGTNDSNYPYTNIIDISGREMDWAVTAVNEYSRDTADGSELDASSNVHFWSDSGTLGNYGNGNFINHPDIGAWIPRTPYDPQNQLTALSEPIKSGGTNATSTTTADYGHYATGGTVNNNSAEVTIQIDEGNWITGKTFFKPNNDATSDYSNPSHKFFKAKSVVNMDLSGATSQFDENNSNGDYERFELEYNSNTFENAFHPDVRNEITALKNNNYYEYYYHIVNTLCKTDLSGARYPNTNTEYGSILTPPGNPSVEYTNSNPSILKILPASFPGNATKPTGQTVGFGPGTLEDELRYSIGWHVNDWWTKNTYEILNYAGSVTRDSYTDLIGSAEGAGTNLSLTTQFVDYGRAFASNLDGDIIVVGGGSWDGKITNESTISGAQANLDQFPSEMDGINRARNGFVKVYKYDYSNNTWSQMGTTIYGNDGTLEKGLEIDPNNANADMRIKHDTGYALDITQDGSILVIGERAAGKTEVTNSNTNNNYARYKGKIRVFEFIEDVNGNKDWAQIGEDIEGDSGEPNGQFGHSVACLKYKRTFTDAGDQDFIRVCAGAPNAAVGGTKRGYVGVYNLNNNLSDKEWTVTVNSSSKYVFTDSNNNTVYIAGTGSDLPITYGEKHIFDYSDVPGHPLGFGFSADGSAISDEDYNALKIERDTDNHKVTLTLKQTHKKDTANPFGSTDRIQGILYYFCTNHNGMGDQFDIENCWVGGTGISNNNSAPQTESNGNGPLQFGIGVAMGFDDTADDDEKLVMTVSSGGEPAAGGSTADWLIAPGQVDAFRYDYDNGTWIAYGNANSTAATTTSPVYGGGTFDDGTSHGTSGNLARSMSLTKDGNYMAIGVAGKDYTPNGGTSQSNVGAVILFKRNFNSTGTNSWIDVGEITGEQHGNNLNNNQLANRNFGKNVSITRLGTDIFIAATTSKTESDDEAGEVLIYKYDETNSGNFTWTGANTNIEKVKNSIVSNGSDLDFGTPDITLTDSQSGSDRKVVITNRGDTVIFGGPERGPDPTTNTENNGQYGSLSVWNSGIYFKKLEGATTASTDENEMTYLWTGETNTFPGNLEVTFKNPGTNGHDSNFDYNPLDSTSIRTSISNRKTANDDWQLGPATIIDSGT
ncbi:fibronectin type III domain-containing protein [Flavobacteriaceae bacterium]|nr:fibronectin type III domain-containing protein [Flavobacteriaceae bacterium]